ncbi:energy coupling factor transporter S component ThiW [Bacillus infantis]|jgi:energy coupling factor transporter S component ThiW|uniref:energy coupling factor transporter S component ThiW n=1 Tax=Bacillus infantis TaxID=324767 RepID=UPI00215550D0|nr:energy coupling factor transporter S component ThiW [Bacillus infantis]MCR6611361.1 energy coupling factor transporter S component ThiW [Bacillus infantis]
MGKTQKLTLAAMMAAVGTLAGSMLYIPLGFAKAFPVQHLLNVLSAVLLGPYYAVAQAFCISLLRNLMGTGSVFAFPGSMAGALLAALLYSRTKKLSMAFTGEVIGTGIIGALLSYPIAVWILGQKAALFGFIPLFIFSSIAGALLGILILAILAKKRAPIFKEFQNKG